MVLVVRKEVYVVIGTKMAKGKETRERILSAAKRIMANKGYVGAGVDEIMQEAGVGKSSFYHFFPSKVALGEAVLDEYVQEFRSEIISKVFESDTRAKERIPAFFCKFADRLLTSNEDTLLVTWSAEVPFLPEELRAKFLSLITVIREGFERTYENAIREYDLFPEAPIEELGENTLSYFLGLLVLSRAFDSPSLLREKAKSVIHLWREYTLDEKPAHRAF